MTVARSARAIHRQRTPTPSPILPSGAIVTWCRAIYGPRFNERSRRPSSLNASKTLRNVFRGGRSPAHRNQYSRRISPRKFRGKVDQSSNLIHLALLFYHTRLFTARSFNQNPIISDVHWNYHHTRFHGHPLWFVVVKG